MVLHQYEFRMHPASRRQTVEKLRLPGLAAATLKRARIGSPQSITHTPNEICFQWAPLWSLCKISTFFLPGDSRESSTIMTNIICEHLTSIEKARSGPWGPRWAPLWRWCQSCQCQSAWTRGTCSPQAAPTCYNVSRDLMPWSHVATRQLSSQHGVCSRKSISGIPHALNGIWKCVVCKAGKVAPVHLLSTVYCNMIGTQESRYTSDQGAWKDWSWGRIEVRQNKRACSWLMLMVAYTCLDQNDPWHPWRKDMQQDRTRLQLAHVDGGCEEFVVVDAPVGVKVHGRHERLQLVLSHRAPLLLQPLLQLLHCHRPTLIRVQRLRVS